MFSNLAGSDAGGSRDLGDRFMEVGACLHATDAMLKQKPPSDAPELLQVVFLSKALNERKPVNHFARL